jgi:integrase
VVKTDGKIAASKWFGQGEKERRLAILWEEKTKGELEKQRTIPTIFLTPLEWANTYLSDVKRRAVQKTYDEKRRDFIRMLKFAGDKPLVRFSPALALSFLQQQYDSRSGYSANKARKNLATAWDWGKSFIDGFPEIVNPFRAVRRFPEERSPRYIPPEADFWSVMQVAEGQDKVMLTAFLHLAARRGEIFKLKWFDLDFIGGQARLMTRKTKDGSVRADWIPMTDELKEILQAWRENRPHKKSEYVFNVLEDSPSPLYKAGDPYKFRQHLMKRLCELAGVKRFGFHAIRHLSASILYRAGIPISDIQRILRHQRPTTTDLYLQSLGLELNQTRKAVEVLSNRGPAKVIPLPVKERSLQAAT